MNMRPRPVDSREVGAAGTIEVSRYWKGLSALGRLARTKPLGAVSALALLLLVLVAILAPWISPHDPLEQKLSESLSPPGGKYLLGADRHGKDILSNIIWGARISLWVGIFAVGLGTSSGAVIGIISGYTGGKTDFIIQRFIDTLMSFPTLLLAITAVTVLGPSINNVMLAISITIMPGVSRIIRGTTLSVKENQYIDAARAIGCRKGRIMFRHILPNVMAPVVILASIGLGSAILAEASLSFLGLGTPPPSPSWGRMLSGQNLEYMVYAPWLLIAPGTAITLAVLAFNLFGDAVRDVLDPRLRGTGTRLGH